MENNFPNRDRDGLRAEEINDSSDFSNFRLGKNVLNREFSFSLSLLNFIPLFSTVRVLTCFSKKKSNL